MQVKNSIMTRYPLEAARDMKLISWRKCISDVLYDQLFLTMPFDELWH